jgi:hypothetical protein
LVVQMETQRGVATGVLSLMQLPAQRTITPFMPSWTTDTAYMHFGSGYGAKILKTAQRRAELILAQPQAWWTAPVYACPDKPLKPDAPKLYRVFANSQLMRWKVKDLAGALDLVILF